MSNIAVALRGEITRLARREIRSHTQGLQRASAHHRRVLADLKRQVLGLRKELALLAKQQSQPGAPAATPDDSGSVRFTAKGLRSQRQRLALSAVDYGRLIGVAGQTIYRWEQEQAHPRKRQVAALAALRLIGKRDALARLEQQPAPARKIARRKPARKARQVA